MAHCQCIHKFEKDTPRIQRILTLTILSRSEIASVRLQHSDTSISLARVGQKIFSPFLEKKRKREKKRYIRETGINKREKERKKNGKKEKKKREKIIKEKKRKEIHEKRVENRKK